MSIAVGRVERRRPQAASPAAWPGCAAAALRTSPGVSLRAEMGGERRRAASPATWRRQKSCTASSDRSRRRSTGSSAKRQAGANGASASARWQKPWIVKIAASSKYCSAASSVARAVARGRCRARARPRARASRRTDRRRPRRRAARSQASVSTMRVRMRSRSSAVAALVKVTTRICCTSSPRSSSSRRYRPQMFQVLPVPAEASIRLMPSSVAVEDVEFGGHAHARPSAGRRR